MKIKNFVWVLLSCVLIVLIASCQPVTSPEITEKKQGYLALNVPQTFNFSTTKTSEIVLSASSLTSSSAVIEIYNENPQHKSATIIRKLYLQRGKTITTKLNLPSWSQEVWVISRQSDGIVITHQVPTNLPLVVVDIAEVGPMTSSLLNSTQAINSDGCNMGCDTFVDGNDLTINDGRTYCVAEGDLLTGTVLFSQQGGSLKVCGTAQLSNINVNGNPSELQIHIEETGIFQINTLNLNSREALLVNRGVLQIANGLAFNYRFENYSEVSLSPFNVNSNKGEFYNFGTLNVAGNLNNSNFIHNQGTINVSGSFNNNSNSTLINDCRIIATGDFHQNALLEHYGYIRANGTLYVQQAGGGASNIYGHSLIEAGSAFINRSLTALQTGTYARLNIQYEIRVNGGGSILGLIDLCLENGSIINNGTINNTVTFCEAVIPATECNPGTGNQANGGGNPNPEDDFPDDPDRNFNNYYPAAGIYGTLAFEDLWPTYGDFDMNDLVVGYNINEVTNLANQVVDIEFTCVIRALGAGMESGFGIELPIPASRVASVTGARLTENIVSINANGTEIGNTNAVIILWDNSAYEMGMFVNTLNPANHVQEDTLVIRVTFTSPVNVSELGLAPYKPFIFVNGDRSHEIHLPGNAPTALANTSLFGLHDDDTKPDQNRYYRSIDNLNWAINIPIEIPYPKETIDITQAYPFFQAWAESGGELYPDWYLDLPGHRIASRLYLKP